MRFVSALTRRPGLWAALSAIVTFAALLIALWVPDGDPIVSGLLIVGLVIFGYRHWRGLVNSRRTCAALTAYLVARFLALATITVVASDRNLDAALGVVGPLALAMVGEILVRDARGKASPYAENVPGERVRARGAFPYGPLATANLILIVLLGLTVFVAPGFIGTLAVLSWMSVAYACAILVDLALRARARIDFESRIGDVIDEIAPVFYLHWHAPAGTAYQIGMWLPYLDRLGVPYVVLVRTVGNFHDAVALTDRPVILRDSLESLDDVVRPSLRGVFYVNTATRNSHLIRYSHLTHIQLNHGDSDKVPSFNPVFRMFDLDFVAGQAAIDRFSANGVSMPPEMFRIVGRPQVENVHVALQPVGDIAEKSVLYAPTWAGFYSDSDYSSLRIAPKVIRALVDRGCRVIFRPHPYSSRDAELRSKCREIRQILERDQNVTGRQHLFGAVAETEMTVVDCINVADAMISDVSSVVGDFLYSEKPLCMVAVSAAPQDFSEQFPMSRAAYVLDASHGTLRGLSETLNELLDLDPKENERRALKKYYLGDIPAETYSQRFVDEALKALGISEGMHLS